jgi:hypothetical protein
VGGLQKELYLPLQEMTKVTAIFKSPKGIDSIDSTAYDCTSLTNEKALRVEEDFLVSYTKRSWLRVYPLGSEISSSNFDPVPHLRTGAQIVALNTQTKDDYALMLMAYFTAGRELAPSKLGYVPKPAHLLRGSRQPRERQARMVHVKVFSSEAITVRLLGSQFDIKVNRDANLSFLVRDYLEGFLLFELGENYKDCLPLRFLKQGYRVLVAKNQFFRDSGKRVLIHLSVKEHYA